MAKKVYMANKVYESNKENAKKNQDRYNAATSGSQSINDYLSSYGVKSDGSYTDKSTGRYYTTVTESDGSKSNGYIKDGVSYYTNGNPINTGASVTDSTGKTWTKGGTTTPVVEEKEYNPYEEYYREAQNRIEEMEAQIREQNRLAVEQGKNRLNAQKSNINQAADENARQAYVQYMQSQKALPQQLASQGVSGGATETANLGLQTAYQNNVNAINQNKANRLQEIDNAIVDLQNKGDLAMVEQVLANNQLALDTYTSAFDKGVGYNQWANQFNANRQDTMTDQAYRDKVYKDQMAQQEKENQWYIDSYKDNKTKEETNRVITLLENGIYNPETASALLGVPTSQLQEFVDYIERARALELSNTQSLINNRNSGGDGKNGTSEIFNTALSLLKEDGWGANDVITYVMGQNLSDERKYEILNTLGLLDDEQPAEYVAPQTTTEIVASNAMNTSNNVPNSGTVQPISINASNAYANTDNIPLNALLKLKGIADGANRYYR
jgi:hypothetical protein